MIVVREGGELVLVTQPDHARLGAALISLWQHDGAPDHPRRTALLEACREHDNGWREIDAAPLTAPDGRPHDFRTLPPPLRIELWQRGTARFVHNRPYVALLATEHALTLHRSRRGQEAYDALLDTLEDRREELLDRLGLTAEELARDYRFLDLADSLSLAVASCDETPFVCRGIAVRTAGRRLELEPFPLAAAVTLPLPWRRIADRRYAGAADLGGALAAARWQEGAIEVARWSVDAPPGGEVRPVAP
jgi:hypothetical protein